MTPRTCPQMVAAQSHQKRKMLEAQQEGLTGFAASLASSCDYVQQTLDRGSDCQMLLAKPVMTARLEDLQVQELALVPETTDTLVVDEGSRELLLAALARFGEVVVCDVAAARSSAEGPGLGPDALQLGDEAAFTVRLRDAAGEPARVPAEALGGVLRVTGPEGGPALAVAPGGGDDGSTATVRYTPTAEGELAISVRVLGGHVPGSPFRVSVWDGPLEIDSAILDGPMKATLAGMLGGGGRRWRARRLCASTTAVAHVADFKREVKDRNGTRTLVVIREANTGYVFGGYVHGPYGNAGNVQGAKLASPENFVFTLGNVTGSPVKLGPNTPNAAHGHNEISAFGVWMGNCGGAELAVYAGYSRCNRPSIYTTVAPGYTAPGPIDETLLAGINPFTFSRIEVFAVEQ